MQLFVLDDSEELTGSVGTMPAAKAAAENILDECTDSAFWSGLLKHIGPLLVSMTADMVDNE